MKRDMDLVRDILRLTEEVGFNEVSAADFVTGEKDRRFVASHFQLLQEAGLLEANLFTLEASGAIDGTVERLTWSGHEFLDATRNEGIWSKTKLIIGNKLGTASFEVIKAVAIKIALGQVGGGQ
jgi:hypothetical protein